MDCVGSAKVKALKTISSAVFRVIPAGSATPRHSRVVDNRNLYKVVNIPPLHDNQPSTIGMHSDVEARGTQDSADREKAQGDR